MATKTPEEIIEGLKKDNIALIRRIDELEDERNAGNSDAGADYELEAVMVPGTDPPRPMTLSRYDGLPESFVYHEALSFRDDSGYSLSAIQDRARDSVTRATDPVRLGGPTCENLPPFDNTLELEILVRILPAGGA